MPSLTDRLHRRFRSRKISDKILLIVLACSALSLFLISSSGLIREYHARSQQQIDQLESLATILSENTVAALRFNDTNTASEYLNSLKSESQITCAALFDRDRNLFAQYDRSAECSDLAFLENAATVSSLSHVRVLKEIVLSGNTVGFISLRADKSAFWEQMLVSLGIHLFVFLAGLAIAFFLAKRLLPLITKPLEELAGIAKRVSKERNYMLRAAKRNDDEIGTLVESVNFMLASVRQRDEAINETNRNLERLVADRTAKLVEARENAERALAAKGEFLATMTHELRTPMNAIIGMSSVLQTDNLDDEQARHIEIIRKSSVNLLDLINDILDYSKIEANRLELEDDPFDLVSCIEESLDIAAAAKSENRLVYASNIDPLLPLNVRGDVTRLRQILVNLLSNAFKFTQAGSVSIDAHLVPSDRSSGERIRISVRDTGIGIPRDRIGAIFESFTQASDTTTREYGGTGLGLTISYRLALAMGGDLKVESEVGTGSVFHLSLPLRRVATLPGLVGRPLDLETDPVVCLNALPPTLDAALRLTLSAWQCRIIDAPDDDSPEPDLTLTAALGESADASAAIASRLESHQPNLVLVHADHAAAVRKVTAAAVLTLPIRQRDLRSLLHKFFGKNDECVAPKPVAPFAQFNPETWQDLRILLAEDNELSRTVFLHHMKLIGLNIDSVSNGIEAQARALATDYDIIFMDVRMPRQDGLETSKQIRQLKKDGKQPWIIGFTANTEAEAIDEIKEAGMDDYLSKPALIVNITKVITRYLQRSLATRAQVK